MDTSWAQTAMVVMLIAAGINTAISAYYYFRVVKQMFLVDVDRAEIRPFAMPTVTKVLVGSMAVAIFAFFILFGVVKESPAVSNAPNVLQGISSEDQVKFTSTAPAEDSESTGHTASTGR